MERKGHHPTCHKLSLTITTKLVAFFDMAFGLFGLVWFVVMLSRYSIISLDPFENLAGAGSGGSIHMTGVNNETNLGMPIDSAAPTPTTEPHHKGPAFAINHKVIALSLVAFYTAVNLSVFVLLLVGVYRRSAGICLIWFHIRCAIFVFKLIILVMYLIGGRPLFHHIPFIASMVVHLYGLWVVNCYVDELKEGEHQQLKTEEGRNNSEQSQQPGQNSSEPDIYDIPNGIEAILKSRILEGQLRAKEKENN